MPNKRSEIKFSLFLYILEKNTNNKNMKGSIEMEKRIFKKVLDEKKIKRSILLNAVKAFLVGGTICLIAQGILWLFKDIIGIEKDKSTSLMYIVIVGVTAILTGLGIFDRIGQFSGAGTIIPITGFSNSMTSAALESKSEGIILGIMSNMFKLAGAVIVAGVVSAFVIGTIIFLFR